MRNPLNSIISQCKIQDQNLKDLSKFVGSLIRKLNPSEMIFCSTIQKNLE